MNIEVMSKTMSKTMNIEVMSKTMNIKTM
jgi:hypothetical protein